MSYSERPVVHGSVVWVGKPWVAPEAALRTVFILVIAVLVFWLQLVYDIAFFTFVGLPLFAWTLIFFMFVWLVGTVQLAVLWASNTYILRQDGLEVKRGIITLRSFLVAPVGFSDLSVYQSVSGRIFGYGDLMVTSQGERKTQLVLVRAPFKTADSLRDVLGKPIVRLAEQGR